MSTTTTRRPRLPVYKRKRRRIYLAATLAVLLVAAVIAWAVSQGSGSSGPAALPSFTISVSQGSVASPDSIIESQPSLAKIDPGAPALRAVRRRRHRDRRDEERQRCRPSAASATRRSSAPSATAPAVDVVIAQSFDDDALLVPKSITSPAQLAGKSVGVLVGSSEDYELLRLARAGAPDRQGQGRRLRQRAGGRRGLPGAVGRRPTSRRPGGQLIAKGDHPLVNAEQIAKLGIPGLNVVAVAPATWSRTIPRSCRTTSAPRCRAPGT